jgi:hypothetical protein
VTKAKGNGDGDGTPGPTPSKLGRLFSRIHKSGQTQRAIADTAKGRRIKAKQERDEKKRKGG